MTADWLRRPNVIQAAIVVLVTVSGGLMAVWGGASALGVLAATLAALVIGVALVAYLSWIVPSPDVSDRDLRRR